MQIDRKHLDLLLSMNDDKLSELIRSIAAEAGVDPQALGLNPHNVQSIRQALSSVNEAELEQLNDVYNTYRQNRRGH